MKERYFIKELSSVMLGVQKSGYLDVKQPSNIKGRKLKSWKQKWVVVQEMSNLASGSYAAKIDLYPNETSSRQTNCDKQTFLLENVTSVEGNNSKTRPLAFQIVETAPVLVLSATSNQETEIWVSFLKGLFFAKVQPKGNFDVAVIENKDAKKHHLSGDYCLSVSPEAVLIQRGADDHMRWRLESLKRFYMERDKPNVIIIESGAKAECGEAKFEFHTDNVNQILQCIQRNIRLAIQTKRQRYDSSASSESRDRQDSVSSLEKGFQLILNGSGQRSRTSSIENKCKPDNENDISTQDNLSGSVRNSIQLKDETDKNKDRVSENDNGDVGSVNTIAENREHLDDVHPYAVVHKPNIEANENELTDVIKKDTFGMKPKMLLRKSLSSPEIIHEYDVLDVGKRTLDDQENYIDTVSTVTVKTEKNQKIEILIDSHGYSHIPVKKSNEKIVTQPVMSNTNNFFLGDANSDSIISNRSSSSIECENEALLPPELPPKTKLAVIDFLPLGLTATSQITQGDGLNIDVENKTRTFSNQSDTQRSTSVGSHDSGVSFMHTDRQSLSLDEESELSTSNISATVNDAIIMTESQMKWSMLHRCNSNPTNQNMDDSLVNCTYSRGHGRSSSEPVGYETLESEYEELDKYRKDLNKFLGMSPTNPPELPPSLPERPSTLPSPRKKLFNQKEKQKKKVSFPLLSITKLRSSSASSGSESEDSSANQPITKLSAWPVETYKHKNDLYETVECHNSENTNSVSAFPSENEVVSPVSPVSQWPLKRSSQAKCNRFYESTKFDTPIDEAQVETISGDVSFDILDKGQDENQMDVSPGHDLLTGDDLYVQPSELLTPQPFDLLGDIPGTIEPISHPPLIPVLDVLLPFVENQTNSELVSDETEYDEKVVESVSGNDTPVLRKRRIGVVEAPFQNLARYSNPLDDMVSQSYLEADHDIQEHVNGSATGVDKISAPNQNCNYMNLISSEDPFDIFHIGILSQALKLDQTKSQEQVKLIDFSEEQEPAPVTMDYTISDDGDCEYLEMNDVKNNTNALT